MRSGYHRDRFGFCCFMMWYFLALNIPTSWYSPVLFLVSPIFVPSLSAKYWDLVRSHLWLTEELTTAMCGRNVLCDEWFSLEPRCKDTTFGFVHHTFLYVSCDSRTFLSRVCGSGMFVFLMLHELYLLDRSVQVVENKPFRWMVFVNKRFSFSCFSYF